MQDTEKWSKASLLIHSDTVSAEEVESLLGVVPSSKHSIGDLVSIKNPNNRRKHNFYCVSSTYPSNESMEIHIESLLNIFEPKKLALQELIKNAEICFSCGFSSSNGQGGFTLSPELLERISNFGIPLSLDLYPPSDAV